MKKWGLSICDYGRIQGVQNAVRFSLNVIQGERERVGIFSVFLFY